MTIRQASSRRGRVQQALSRLAVLLLLIVMTGCSAIQNHMYRTSGTVMQGLSKDHTTPYLLQQDDVGMSCAMSEATTPMMMSFGRVTDNPDQLGIMMNLSAAGCSQERAWERELEYLKAMGDRNASHARDAQYGADRHHREAALRFHRSWKHLNVHYGDIGDQSCPTDRFDSDLDEFMYMSGLLAGLQAMGAQVAAGQSLGVPDNIAGRVERGAQCLDNEKWWGVPLAMRAAIWSMLESVKPEGEDPFERLDEASAMGEEAGVRVANVLHALAADNASKDERLRSVIRRHAEAIHETDAHPDWVMVDETATRGLMYISDRLWMEAQGHRTPTGRLGHFWDDEAPEEDDSDLEGLL